MLGGRVDPYEEEQLAKNAMRAIDDTLAMIAEFSLDEVTVGATGIAGLAEEYKGTNFGVMMLCAASLLMAAASGKLVRKGAENEVPDRTDGKSG